jgi:hypothetical protein
VWRALKALGAGILRDGAYLLPAQPQFEAAFAEQRSAIEQAGGAALLFRIPAVEPDEDAAIRALFDRGSEYDALLSAIRSWAEHIDEWSEFDGRRGLRQLKRDYEALASIDFFPTSAQVEVRAALQAAETAFTRRIAPEEPIAATKPIERLDAAQFRGRTWATRKHLWVDRVASAWLIRRFVDPKARFVWLEHPHDLPPTAIGFDFDDARFTHVGELITFEVLLESFGLDSDPALTRIGKIIRALDTGTVMVREAAGFEAMLTGARQRYADDDQFLSSMSDALDSLHAAYSGNKASEKGAQLA